MVTTGLEAWLSEQKHQQSLKGRIGLLCHNASCTSDFEFAPSLFQKIYGKRLIRLFGPQHGLITDVQDNMIESDHFTHPHFKLPVFSLYSETRAPTDEMLDGLNTLVIDLQDVGTRVYTYISTLALIMEKAQGKDIEIVVLDRPNPVRGDRVEGTMMDPKLQSFVGQINVPHRHGLTLGEVGHFIKKTLTPNVNYRVISMMGWQRDMDFFKTGLPWLLPSPNLPTPEGALVFAGSVLFEGTNLSEGRGTTRSLEMLGHPEIEPFEFTEKLKQSLLDADLLGQILRPVYFRPTFQKWAGRTCGGIQIHPTDSARFRSWAVGQMVLRDFYHHLGPAFEWNKKRYEYEEEHLAIDYINGQFALREWVEKNGSFDELLKIEEIGRSEFMNLREDCLIY